MKALDHKLKLSFSTYHLLLVFMSSVLLGCQDVVRPQMPEKLIPKSKMVDILVEAYIGNAARSNNNRVLRLGGVQLDSILYAKYDIDSLQFARNTAYYAAEIDPYLDILEAVETELSVMKKSLDSLALIDAQKQKKDKQQLIDSAKTNILKQSLVPAISQ